ncbi:MAG: hypothetical protein AMJ59_22390 [Gammaproteobacteria bacterium SG8_31]|nr:MAG: hypothetical protein AMJ59_22390 [Gammaproteobacteria bacterium SG8_31]
MGDGPVANANLDVFNKNDELVLTYSSDDQASYTFTIKEKGKNYPVRFLAYNGRDMVTGTIPDFVMTAALLRPAKKSRGNINPHSTIMIGIADRLGGINDVNYYKGRDIAMAALNFGMDRALIDDPVAADVTDLNAPMLVKASESLGEMVRRTRDALIGTGVTTGDAVMAALSADLVDGVLDGRGANGVDTRIAAVATLTSAQVLVEGLVNDLKVNGVSATQRMDDAIQTIMPRAPASVNTESVLISAGMLKQAKLTLQAAWALTRDPAIDELYNAVTRIPAGSKPASIRGTLPDADASLATAVETAAYGSSEDLELVNSTMRLAAAPEPPADPEIGFADSQHQLAEGGQTLILVERANGDGPAWVDYEFVAGTATPGVDYASTPGRVDFADGQTAKYITVTAFQDSVSEGAETFEVHLVGTSDGSFLNANTVASVTIADDEAVAPTLGNATLRWTPPTEREDGSVLDNLAGYKVHYGTSQSNLSTVVVLDNPGLSSYVVDNLDQGTWYFAVTAFDADGRESSFSNVGSKMIL